MIVVTTEPSLFPDIQGLSNNGAHLELNFVQP